MLTRMRIAYRKRLQWVVGGLIVLLILMILFLGLIEVHWVGGTDLTVEFVTIDADTGQPIAGSTIKINSEGGFYKESEPRDFELTTGGDGTAQYQCLNSMCFGTSGMFTNTFVVHLPWWNYTVSAPGYQLSERIYLDTSETARQVKRTGPGVSKVVVPIPLHQAVP
ncbi:MAG TPA: hypothetical protein VG122_03590 [Gemmata sp.]|jgi:hypothetical protein|nr:hypothetical protein [Gemmata sp.]